MEEVAPKERVGGYKLVSMLERFQKALHTNQMKAETFLLCSLRNHRLQGWKFRCQHILQGYIVDYILETILNTPHPPLRGDLSRKGRGKEFYYLHKSL